MSQACGVEGFGPGQRCLEGAAVAALVARGPGDDAGAVLLPVNAQAHPVHSGFGPLGVVSNGLVPVLHLVIPGVVGQETGLGAMALVVGLGHDVEAVLVAQLVEARIVGVVGAAHRVDVVLLHQPQVALHVGEVDDRTSERVGVVPVDPAQGDGTSVDPDDDARDPDLTQPHPVSDDLVRCGDHQGVEVGVLGAPQMRFLHRQVDSMAIAVTTSGRVEGLQLPGGDGFALMVHQRCRGGRHAAAKGSPQLDDRVAACCLLILTAPERGGDGVVEEDRAWPRQEVDVPEDAAGAELVLILQVGAVAPLEYQDSKTVGAGTDVLGDVELTGGMGDLAVTDVGAVEPHVKTGVHALECQVGAGSLRNTFVLEIL